MIRILTGSTWKLNPDYRSHLRATAERRVPFRADAVLDVLGIEVDGVNLIRGLREEAIFDVAARLIEAVGGLFASPSATGHVSLDEAGVELVFGRHGRRVDLCLVALGRSARVLTREVSVELDALAGATADCAEALLVDLQTIHPELIDQSWCVALREAAAALRRRNRRAPTSDGPHPAPVTLEPTPQRTGGPLVGFVLSDDDGRVDRYRGGADLYSLLSPGQLFLLDEDGVELMRVSGRPFLLLTELLRTAGRITAAAENGEAALRFNLGEDSPELELQLESSMLIADGRALPCEPLRLSRAFAEATLDFAGAIASRNPAQRENTYLSELSESARERLAQIQELSEGEREAEPPAIRPALPRPRVEAPLGPGNLKRLRFRPRWGPVDVGTGPRQLVRHRQLALVSSGDGLISLDLRTGRRVGAIECEEAALHDTGALALRGSRMFAVDARGRSRWLRDLPAMRTRDLTVAPTRVHAGRARWPVRVVLLDSGRILGLHEDTGMALWEFRPPSASRLFVATSPDLVYVAADTGVVYGISPDDGTVWWRQRTGLTIEGAPVAGRDHLLVWGRGPEGRRLVAIDRYSGRQQFSAPLELSNLPPPLFLRTGFAVAGVDDEARSAVAVYDAAGRPRFQLALADGLGPPALLHRAGRLFASLRDGSTVCLTGRGAQIWRIGPAGNELHRALAPELRRHVLLTPGDPVRALDPETGRLLCELPPTPGLFAMVAGANLEVLLVDEDGVARMYELATHLSVV